MAQQSPPMETRKLRPPITKSETRQIHRLTKLRNSTHRQQQAKPQQHTKRLPSTPDTTPIPQATNFYQLTDPPNIEDIPSLCNKAIATITSKIDKKTSGYPTTDGERTIQEKRQTMPPKL